MRHGSKSHWWQFWKWFSRQKKKVDRSFRSVVPTARLVEFRGVLPRMPATIEHRLFCQRITTSIGKTLLAEGFRGVGTLKPTHVFYCVAYLDKDNGKPRLLFNLYIALSEIRSIELQNWAAIRIAHALKDALIRQSEPFFLIRCKNDREFPWCLGSDEIDDYWFTEAGLWYRFYIKRLRKTRPDTNINEIMGEDGDRTIGQ